MANIWRVDRANNKIEMGTTGTTINVDSHTASQPLGLDASKNLESINLTQGSVVFVGTSGVLSQDNSNLFWDDTINRLGVGINSGFFPATGITVSGEMDLIHTSSEPDDHAFELDIDAAGYGDVKAIDIDYITGDITVGEDEAVILINIDEIGATGAADVFGLEVLATEGTAGIYGMKVGVVIGPIHQDSGTFENPTVATNDTISTNVPYMIDGLIANTTAIFLAEDDYILIGDIAVFEEIEFIITTGSSGAGIKPKFEYSTAGSHTFTEFFPVDGTNGFRNTGVVAWDASDLTSHGLNTDTTPDTYCIKITRQRANLTTPPVLGFTKTAATIEYIWDKDGNVNIKTLTISTIAAEGSDVDKFLVDSSGVIKYRTGTQILSDIGGSASGHDHSGVYQPLDAALTDLADVGVVGADSEFLVGTGAGALAWENAATAKTSIGLGNVENTQLSTWAGSSNITTLGTIATVGNITIADGGTIGQAAGPLLTFDDTNNILGITDGSIRLYRAVDDEFMFGVRWEKDRVGATVENNDVLGYLRWSGHDGTGYIECAEIEAHVDGVPGTNDMPGRLLLKTTPAGGVSSLTRIYISNNGKVNVGTVPAVTKLTVEGALTLKEQAAADADTAAYGQVWVKDTSPCELWFTKDDGTDVSISAPFSAYTTEDSNSDAMFRTHAYKAATDGFVSVLHTIAAAGNQIYGYVGTTTDPYNDGVLVANQEADANGSSKSIFFAVAKDEYFEIRAVAGTPTILWKSVGPLSKPVDQD